MANILVFSEQRDGKVKRVALEALGTAKSLAGEKGQVIAVLLGDNLDGQKEILSSGGADKIYIVDHADLKHYSSEAYGTIVSNIAKKENTPLILMGATAMGKDLGPKVAAKLEGPFAGDCIKLDFNEDEKVVVTRPIYGGKAISTLQSHQNSFQVVTLRPNVFPPIAEPASKQATVEPYAGDVDFSTVKAIVKEVLAAASSKIELTEASIIVSGGRGLKAPENFSIIEDLAEALGAAVGASRAAVDAGWKPHAYQVGLTGKTVSPTLYIACGISGAIQHLAGMSSSKYIVAINKDSNAPIFKIASYGIVGDLFEVVPLLTEAVKKMKKESS